MRKIHSKMLFVLLFALSLTQILYAQTGNISGRVTNEMNQPLAGSSVIIKGLNKSVSTDANGNFKLSGVPFGSQTLTASYLGFQSVSKNVQVNGDVTVNFQLNSSSSSLTEVVVVGYGTQTRRETTGAITKVTAERLTSAPTPSFEAGLAGKAAGVQVSVGSGMAGSASVVRVRGMNSISGTGDPLYVVDGIPITSDPFSGAGANTDYRIRSGFNQNPLATLNAEDIESIEILKDAGAAGIYGSRGSNGVILITTKRGKSGKPSFNFSTKLGISNPAYTPQITNSTEWLQLRQEAWENDGNTGLAPLPAGVTRAMANSNNTNWWDLMTQTGFSQQYNLSANGSYKKLKYFLGTSYSDDNSYVKGNAFKRINFRGNFDYDFSDKFSINLSSSWAQGINNRVLAAWAGGIGDAMSAALPIYPVKVDPATNNGNPYFYDRANPVRSLEGTDWRTRDTRTINNLFLNYKPIKDLTIRLGGGFDYNDVLQDRFQNKFLIDGANPKIGEIYRWPIWVYNYNATGTATYNLNLGNKHKLTFLAGSEYQRSQTRQYNSIYLRGDNASNAFYQDPALLEKATITVPNNASDITGKDRLIPQGGEWAFISFFGRINYTLKDRYVLQGLLRTDGSSRFGPDNKYGFFPALSAAWIASEEDFIKNIDWLSLLKLRASYGITGNANIESDRWRAYYTRSSDTYGGQSIIIPSQLENNALKWESQRNIDIALEIGLLKDRIAAEISYYDKLSDGVLLRQNTSTSTGYGNNSSVYGNFGKIQNNGLEFNLNTRNIVSANFTWTTNFNIATNRNKVLDLSGLPPAAVSGGQNDTRAIVGYPVGTNFIVRYYGVDPADGLPIWLDQNGNKSKTFSLDYRVPTGKVTPDYFGGITNTFKYKGWELSALFSFVQGVDLWDNSGKFQFTGVSANQNWVVRKDFLDRWQKPGDQTRYPRLFYNNPYPGLGSNNGVFSSTMFLYDGSYIRLRELTLAYNLPKNILTKARVTNARLFLTGTNLLTWTKYPGGDPEVARDYENVTDRNLSPNVNYLTLPQQRIFQFGINANF